MTQFLHVTIVAYAKDGFKKCKILQNYEKNVIVAEMFVWICRLPTSERERSPINAIENPLILHQPLEKA